MLPPPPASTLFPYTTLFRSVECEPDQRPIDVEALSSGEQHELVLLFDLIFRVEKNTLVLIDEPELSLHPRSEEHTSELQSRRDLVCRLLLEKKKKNSTQHTS